MVTTRSIAITGNFIESFVEKVCVINRRKVTRSVTCNSFRALIRFGPTIFVLAWIPILQIRAADPSDLNDATSNFEKSCEELDQCLAKVDSVLRSGLIELAEHFAQLQRCASGSLEFMSLVLSPLAELDKQRGMNLRNSSVENAPGKSASRERRIVENVWNQVLGINNDLLVRNRNTRPRFDEKNDGLRSADILLIENAVWKTKAAAPTAINDKLPFLWIQLSLWRKGLVSQPTFDTKEIQIGNVDYFLMVIVRSSDAVLEGEVKRLLSLVTTSDSFTKKHE